jgi:hypothetical protein
MAEQSEPPKDDPKEYVGLTVDEARELAGRHGWTRIRVLPPGALITMEYLVGRMNFEADGDRVVRCWTG